MPTLELPLYGEWPDDLVFEVPERSFRSKEFSTLKHTDFVFKPYEFGRAEQHTIAYLQALSFSLMKLAEVEVKYRAKEGDPVGPRHLQGFNTRLIVYEAIHPNATLIDGAVHLVLIEKGFFPEPGFVYPHFYQRVDNRLKQHFSIRGRRTVDFHHGFSSNTGAQDWTEKHYWPLVEQKALMRQALERERSRQ